jgi:hypothetical protein
MEDSTMPKKANDDMGVQNEGKPSKVKPYEDHHYQENFQERQEDQR